MLFLLPAKELVLANIDIVLARPVGLFLLGDQALVEQPAELPKASYKKSPADWLAKKTRLLWSSMVLG